LDLGGLGLGASGKVAVGRLGTWCRSQVEATRGRHFRYGEKLDKMWVPRGFFFLNLKIIMGAILLILLEMDSFLFLLCSFGFLKDFSR